MATSRRKPVEHKVKTTKKGGHSPYVQMSPNLEGDLEEWIMDGKSLNAWCRDRNVNRVGVFRYYDRNPDFKSVIDHARKVAAWAHEDDTHDIVDDPLLDPAEKKLKIWHRKWLAEVHEPDRYSPAKRLDVTSNGETMAPLNPEKRAARIIEILGEARRLKEAKEGRDDGS